MIHFQHLDLSDSFSILYRFPKRGDGLPMHDHPRETEHDVRCLAGRVRITCPRPGKQLELATGESCTFDDPQAPHEIVALEDDSVTRHYFLHGIPEGYRDLPVHEKEGSTETGPMKFPLEQARS